MESVTVWGFADFRLRKTTVYYFGLVYTNVHKQRKDMVEFTIIIFSGGGAKWLKRFQVIDKETNSKNGIFDWIIY